MSRQAPRTAVASAVATVIAEHLMTELSTVAKVRQEHGTRETLILLTTGERFRIRVEQEP